MKRLIEFIVLSTIIVGCVPQASGPDGDGDGNFFDILFGPGAGDIFDNAHGVPPMGAIVPEAVGSVSVRVVSQSRVAADVLIVFYVDDTEVHRTVLHVTAFKTTNIFGPDAANRLTCSGIYSTGGATPPLTLVFGDGFADGDLVEYIIPDPSTDGSGQPIPDDACPDDPDKIEPGVCGCGVPDADNDGDGVPDCIDICPGADDRLDSDGDGVPDGCDICPAGNDAIDSDGDGVPDACDICPGGDDLVDTDGDGIPDACDAPPPPPPPPPPPGNEACCFFDGSCSDMTAAACLADEGSPQGPGTTCATTSCEQPPDTEACCFADGSCSELTTSECLYWEGTPQGSGSNCLTTSCELPPETEACCFFDGGCSDMPAASCEAYEGTPQGPGTNCATTSCPPPPLPEACCFFDGSCSDMPAASCEAYEGTPQGPGTNCATTSCPQPATEACCFANGSCSDITPSDCLYWGGMPQGTGTDCATSECPQPVEACCYSGGGCEDTTVDACLASSGTPQGPGTDCSTTSCPQPLEACCFSDGSCSDLIAWDCEYFEGTPQGPGTDCATSECPQPVEACCYPGGVCENVPYDACLREGGTPQGPGTDCSTTQCVVPFGPLVYVDANAEGANNGTSWDDAFSELADALRLASEQTPSPGEPIEIWVAAGIYKPDPGLSDRSASFPLLSNVAIYGGFTAGQANRDDRNPDPLTNDTLLSGDIGYPGSSSDNSYNVVTATGTSDPTVMDGFTITGGNASGSGGGLLIQGAVVTVSNCAFVANQAASGGGIYSGSGSILMLTDCIFDGNTALASGGGLYNYASSALVQDCTFVHNEAGSSENHNGGGIRNVNAIDTTVINCLFRENRAADAGAGMSNHASSVGVFNCTFERNDAFTDAGGGMNNHTCNPTIANCAFLGNKAYWAGGGMFNYDAAPLIVNSVFVGNDGGYIGGGAIHNRLTGSSPIIVNCTFVANESYEGGGIYSREGANPLVMNSILWNNTVGQVFGTAAITYCDVQGGPSGTDGNIDVDPLFVQWPSTGSDEIWGTADDNYGNVRLRAGSPCIDAGNNGAFPDILSSTDFDGNPRFVDDPDVPDTGLGTAPIIDMGAFESQGL